MATGSLEGVHTFALNTGDWLETNVVYNPSGTTGTWPEYWNNHWQPYCYHYIGNDKPIKLTLAEVELLRQLAKKDDRVKRILQKFTDLIEITVDFG